MRIHQSIVLALVIAVPVLVHAVRAPSHPCFTAGSATYQIVAGAPAPDYKVRIDNAAAFPDLRIRLVDDPDTADLVLVDDIDGAPGHACQAPALTTIRVDRSELTPDVTVSLGADVAAPDYRVYVRSLRFSPHDAAGLLAAMWKSGQTRRMAAHL